MPGLKPSSISLSPRHRELLERLQRRQTSSQRLIRRIKIIMEAADDLNNEQIARRLNLDRSTVRYWRGRWPGIVSSLEDMEAALRQEGEKESRIESLLLCAMEEGFTDLPRPGTPSTFTPEQIVGILALSLESPGECGRPVSPWTSTELADEAVVRGIVERISPRTAGRFLKGERPQAPPQPILAQPGDRG